MWQTSRKTIKRGSPVFFAAQANPYADIKKPAEAGNGADPFLAPMARGSFRKSRLARLSRDRAFNLPAWKITRVCNARLQAKTPGALFAKAPNLAETERFRNAQSLYDHLVMKPNMALRMGGVDLSPHKWRLRPAVAVELVQKLRALVDADFEWTLRRREWTCGSAWTWPVWRFARWYGRLWS
jgi:hypothetical protein